MQYIASGNLFFTGVRYDFYHEAEGSLKLCSATTFSKAKYIVVKFKPRDTVWSKAKAQIGLLERLTVKDLFFTSVTTMYKDTYNRVWNENELIDEADAVALAIYYWESIEAKLEAYQESAKLKC